jgi:hypothetical protein
MSNRTPQRITKTLQEYGNLVMRLEKQFMKSTVARSALPTCSLMSQLQTMSES